MNPPDLGISVGEAVAASESIGEVLVLEDNPEILRQWVDQALATDARILVLNYIMRTHPNVDIKAVRGVIDERVKDKYSREG